MRLILPATLRLAALLLLVAGIAFALVRLSPVDPVAAYLGPGIARLQPEQRERIEAAWGLDQPAPVQFGRWLGHVLSGDLGWSTSHNAPVATVIAERGAATLRLALPALVLSGALGFALGTLAGTREGSRLDRAVRLYAYLLAATPTFWLAIVALTVFSVQLGWAPLCCSGPIGVTPDRVTLAETLAHLALPLGVLTLFGVAPVALHTREAIAAAMRSDHALFAFAQGASRRDVAWRHAARAALLPALTIVCASLGEILGGAVLAEQVFAYPGLGRATVQAGTQGDVPLLLALTLMAAALVATGNLVADRLYARIDPRLGAPGPIA
ncbi:ABC transporter permease [Aureimonas phyllosphaerae]|uniref:Peptide/nickel transport system permease protein n=1 Tax=Aureimonas phyllosphaerae TaxID=1166078 RepID=A0A7W6FUK3_9HYPH|nr:ABC transporter permease [Aureimonas phyllosphaerae]MBB3936168.1 peptide/nickel transport system permease protein [Aureimonas phyllosphaerae]MBB3960107.1 peptide/nickel transport system permease protein [Aureimonas phyllosphaerae]SFF33321.1 peptide/nickel transport system permease protein [Aureimonas phyllosphaerae]